MMQRVTKRLRITVALLLTAVLLVILSGEVLADDSLLAQTPAPVSNVVSGRSFTVEIGIVVVMFGGALFAVCRSSNRT